MNNTNTDTLRARNDKIIKALLDKVNDGYGEYVDLIAITGSFHSGDIHPLSDLDLMIVINDDKAYDISRCFILGDVGYDIYCIKWDSLYRMAEYHDAHVIKLMDVEFIYSKPSALKKYAHLHDSLRSNMADSSLLKKRAASHAGEALWHLRMLDDAYDLSSAYMHLAGFMIYIEYALYAINGRYIKGGIKDIPDEISDMPILPDDFTKTYLSLPNLHDIGGIRENCKKIADIVCRFIKDQGVEEIITHKVDIAKEERVKEIPTKENFKSTYEELQSNWRGKMYHAYDIRSNYLSFMSMASAQNYFNEMADHFDIGHIDLISEYDSSDLRHNITAFENSMAEFLKNYDAIGLEVSYFAEVDDLDKLYN